MSSMDVIYCTKSLRELECRKKKHDNNSSKPGSRKNQKNILSLNKSTENSEYQSDSGADFHVAPNEGDFSAYSVSSQIVFVAGGRRLSTAGEGDLIFPTSDGKTETLKGAVHIPSLKTRILSTAQLESQGFMIRWPFQYRDVELIRPDGSLCAVFRRESRRLLWKPHISAISARPKIYSTERDWYLILGHPGQKTQDAPLKLAGIKGYKSPSNCETCTKTKITKSKGHSSLRHSSAFAGAIHLDLVGGQKSLTPTTSDNSAPTATWFLLTVHEYTSWKWAWPIYSKKTVPTCINNFSQHLRAKFGKVPKYPHTDSGNEFSNSEVQQILLSHGIEWRKSSSHAPEQNGITERNVRTVIEKMRALHL
ncbi:hypothetical protein K3495_g6025 [Podosphaera aphanis]|nr:hypothetical protein K3495_g6025 [Podosphaera aphanis]